MRQLRTQHRPLFSPTEAYTQTLKDPELLAEAAKRGWDVDPFTGAELEVLAKEVINQPKDVIERMKWVLGN